MTIAFSGSPLDRADPVREDPEAQAAARADPRATVLRLDGFDPVPDSEGLLAWGPLADAPADAELVFLGLDQGVPRFAVSRPGDPPAPARSFGVFGLLERLRPDQLGIYAAARSVVDWHARHRHCAVCGTPTHVFRGGWARKCPNCGAEHYPRTDPVVIMLAEFEDRALLGRGAAWPERRFSALAGFVEPGETIEEAVRRETLEEAGVRVGAVRYIASQPWPFPSQLMIACIGEAADDAITLDKELAEAIWVTRDEVRAALAGDERRFIAPPRFAIARVLLETWAGGGN